MMRTQTDTSLFAALHRRVLPACLIGTAGLLASGCGGRVVTDAPLSVEESRELEDQRAIIQQQLAREAAPRRPG